MKVTNSTEKELEFCIGYEGFEEPEIATTINPHQTKELSFEHFTFVAIKEK